MKAIELSGLEGFKSLRVADVEKPKPAANQILIEVMAAGINFAELGVGIQRQNRFRTCRPKHDLAKIHRSASDVTAH